MLPRPGSYEHGNRESRPLKPSHLRVHLLGWRVAIRFLGSNHATARSIHDLWLHLLPNVRNGGGSSALQPLCTTSSRTTTPTGAMSTSATGSGAAGYVLIYPLSSTIKIMIISIIYMFMSLRSYKHIHDVTNLLIIAILWIKLLLKWSKILTI